MIYPAVILADCCHDCKANAVCLVFNQVLLIWMLWLILSNVKLSKEWSTTLARRLVSCSK